MTQCKDGLKNWVKAGGDKEASLSAKPTARGCSHRPAGQERPFREHASTFLVPVQHHTGTSQCGSSLAIPLRVSDEWHRQVTLNTMMGHATGGRYCVPLVCRIHQRPKSRMSHGGTTSEESECDRSSVRQEDIRWKEKKKTGK